MKPFTDVLREMRKGRVVTDATDKLAAVVEAVLETHKAGTVTLELTVKPQKGDKDRVTIIAKVKAKTPEEDLPESIFYVDKDFNLLRDDPNQRELFAEAAPKGLAQAAE